MSYIGLERSGERIRRLCAAVANWRLVILKHCRNAQRVPAMNLNARMGCQGILVKVMIIDK